MLQRLGIADALVKDPSVLILDEPTTSIDPIGVIEILDMLRGLVRDRGLAVLLSSHLLKVQSVCDRVGGIFAAGQLIGVSTVESSRSSGRIRPTSRSVSRMPAQPSGPRSRSSWARSKGLTRSRPLGQGEPFVLVDAHTARSVRETALRIAAASGLGLSSIRETVPSLDGIYRHAVRQAGLHNRRVAA